MIEEIKKYFSDGRELRSEIIQKWFQTHNCFLAFLAFLNEICDYYSVLGLYDNLPEDQKSDTMQDIPWGGLIEAAFVTRKPIIFSANRQHNLITTSWDDFITLVPEFANNTHDIRSRRGENKRRPIITFGLSLRELNDKNDMITLYLLEYLRLNDIIGELIDEYIHLFRIDAKNFLSQIQELKNSTYKEEKIHESTAGKDD